MKKNRCIILLPTSYNDGKAVPAKILSSILQKIDEKFDGHTVSESVDGTYRMADGTMKNDKLIPVWIAVDQDKIDLLRKMTGSFARTLKQESVYFEVMNSEVEFIEPNAESEGA